MIVITASTTDTLVGQGPFAHYNKKQGEMIRKQVKLFVVLIFIITVARGKKKLRQHEPLPSLPWFVLTTACTVRAVILVVCHGLYLLSHVQ